MKHFVSLLKKGFFIILGILLIFSNACNKCLCDQPINNFRFVEEQTNGFVFEWDEPNTPKSFVITIKDVVSGAVFESPIFSQSPGDSSSKVILKKDIPFYTEGKVFSATIRRYCSNNYKKEGTSSPESKPTIFQSKLSDSLINGLELKGVQNCQDKIVSLNWNGNQNAHHYILYHSYTDTRGILVIETDSIPSGTTNTVRTIHKGVNSCFIQARLANAKVIGQSSIFSVCCIIIVEDEVDACKKSGLHFEETILEAPQPIPNTLSWTFNWDIQNSPIVAYYEELGTNVNSSRTSCHYFLRGLMGNVRVVVEHEGIDGMLIDSNKTYKLGLMQRRPEINASCGCPVQ